jgi:hypothetical protein
VEREDDGRVGGLSKLTVLLGPIGIEKYGQRKAKQREQVSKELFEELAKCSDALVALLFLEVCFAQRRLGQCQDLRLRCNFVHEGNSQEEKNVAMIKTTNGQGSIVDNADRSSVGFVVPAATKRF